MVGVMRSRGPDLLAAHHEVAVVHLGTGGQRRQVATGSGLAHPQAPGDLGAQRGPQVPLPEEVAAVVQDRRCDDPEPLRVGRALGWEPRHLLVVDELLHGRQVPPPELRRPSGDQQARVEQTPLPAAAPAGQVRGARHGLGAHLLQGRLVRLEPRAQLGPELLGRGVVVELHVTPRAGRRCAGGARGPSRTAPRASSRA